MMAILHYHSELIAYCQTLLSSQQAVHVALAYISRSYRYNGLLCLFGHLQ